MLFHYGDDGMHYASVWIAPQRDFAMLVCVNQSRAPLGTEASSYKACEEALAALIGLHNSMAGAKCR